MIGVCFDTHKRYPDGDEHWGLALIYGFRHQCNSCKLFSLVSIKHTGGDPGHQHNYLRRISVPLLSANGVMFNVHIKTHCTDWFDPYQCDLIFVETNHGLSYWEPLMNKMESIPPYTFVYVLHGGKTIAAWIHAEILEGQNWQPIWSIDELEAAIHLDHKSTKVDGKRFPCAPFGKRKSL